VTTNAEQSRAVLVAYQQVMAASWPDLHPEMAARASGWASADAAALERELQGYLRTASAPDCRVRVFWKLTPGYTFGGCNEHFAHDAGLAAADMIGIDDFDRRLPWVHQAAKYRADDESVVKSGRPNLNIVERQRSATGAITWVKAGKAPIRTSAGVIGVLGMYELLDAEAGRKAFAEQNKRTGGR